MLKSIIMEPYVILCYLFLLIDKHTQRGKPKPYDVDQK